MMLPLHCIHQYVSICIPFLFVELCCMNNWKACRWLPIEGKWPGKRIIYLIQRPHQWWRLKPWKHKWVKTGRKGLAEITINESPELIRVGGWCDVSIKGGCDIMPSIYPSWQWYVMNTVWARSINNSDAVCFVACALEDTWIQSRCTFVSVTRFLSPASKTSLSIIDHFHCE